jgi:putative flippase GtrA
MTASSFASLDSAGPTRRSAGEFARYFACSAIALTADFGLYSLGLGLGLSYPVAAVFGFIAGLWLAYFLSVRYVFRERALSNRLSEFSIFAAIGVFGLLLTEALLWLLVDHAGLHPLAAKGVTAGAVFISNFALRKGILFTQSKGRLQHDG